MAVDIDNRNAIYSWIEEHTPLGGSVLDLGCGDGELLARLAGSRGIRGTGIEISHECVMRAVQHGLSVHHGNIEEGLDHYSDKSFDLATLALTLQEVGDLKKVIDEAFRVSKLVIVVFPNFGYWHERLQLAICGRAPQSRNLPYKWHDSPNQHYFTVSDWEEFCRERKWSCVARGYLAGGRKVSLLPNLRAEIAMYLMEKVEG